MKAMTYHMDLGCHVISLPWPCADWWYKSSAIQFHDVKHENSTRRVHFLQLTTDVGESLLLQPKGRLIIRKNPQHRGAMIPSFPFLYPQQSPCTITRMNDVWLPVDVCYAMERGSRDQKLPTDDLLQTFGFQNLC